MRGRSSLPLLAPPMVCRRKQAFRGKKNRKNPASCLLRQMGKSKRFFIIIIIISFFLVEWARHKGEGGGEGKLSMCGFRFQGCAMSGKYLKYYFMNTKSYVLEAILERPRTMIRNDYFWKLFSKLYHKTGKILRNFFFALQRHRPALTKFLNTSIYSFIFLANIKVVGSQIRKKKSLFVVILARSFWKWLSDRLAHFAPFNLFCYKANLSG